MPSSPLLGRHQSSKEVGVSSVALRVVRITRRQRGVAAVARAGIYPRLALRDHSRSGGFLPSASITLLTHLLGEDELVDTHTVVESIAPDEREQLHAHRALLSLLAPCLG